MRTFKRCAVSHDNPDYLIRNKYVLLHQNGNTYFSSAQRAAHPVPPPRPLKVVNVEAKFGMSGDSPLMTPFSPINSRNPVLFESSTTRANSRRLVPISPHATIKSCLRESKGDTATFNKMIRVHTRERPLQKKIFSVLLRRSASQEDQIKSSLLNPNNLQNLKHSVKTSEDSPYSRKLSGFFSTMRRSTKSLLRGTTKRFVSTNGFAFMLTETQNKLLPH